MPEYWANIISSLISFAGLVFVGVQLMRDAKNREIQSVIEIYDINRDLITLGFSQPELFKVLKGADIQDAELQQRYLQLWINQMAPINVFLKQAAIKGELKESLLTDQAEFFELPNVKKHWGSFGKFYPKSFQKTVADLTKKESRR